MKCMKCGTSIPSDQAFCEPCREEMERYPVKPGTPIQLPNRPEKVTVKSNHKKPRKPEDQIANLKSFIFWLLLLIIGLITMLAVVLSILLPMLDEAEPVGNLAQQCISFVEQL